MFNPKVLIFGYADVLQVKGATTLGSKAMLNGMNLERITEISQTLKDGSWTPGVARGVWALKKKAGETSLLMVLPIKDKIVASAMKIVFNIIFEKPKSLDMLSKDRYFHNFSYGFRPNKGCHSALGVIVTWGFASWFIKADLEKCYDTINQKRLLFILEQSFKDPLMRDTLNKFFKMPVKNVEKGGADTSKGVGVPHGNPLSPFLVNICLNEFDYFMDDLKKEIDKGISVNTITKE
jgi:retron-type reverse transcriptase